MTTIWLFLWLGGLVHALALYGFDTKHPGGRVLLLPFLLFPLVAWLRKHHPRCFGPSALRIAGLLALASGMLFLGLRYHLHWDTDRVFPGLWAGLLGLSSFWVALGRPSRQGFGAWSWVAFWMAAGHFDPLLPLLGAGVAAFASAWDLMPGEAEPTNGQSLSSFLLPFLLGLALPKPWWDWGLQPAWAGPMTSFGLAAGLASLPTRLSGDRWPKALLLGGIGALAVLYDPRLGLLWGALLGLLTGAAWRRLPRPLPLLGLAYALLLGLAISFVLHANAWIPGLRHLIWLGN